MSVTPSGWLRFCAPGFLRPGAAALRPPHSRVRRSVRRAGLIVSVAGASASLAAQAPRTGWEGVKPTGWPGQTAAPAAAVAPPERTEAAVATPVARSRGSRTTRRKVRNPGGRRSAPAWITLEWDAPPPLDVALDWSSPTLRTSPIALVVRLPESPATRDFVRTSIDAADAIEATEAAAVADEARLPVTTMIHASAPAPAAPRAISIVRSSERASRPRVSGFRALMGRMADALGLRRGAVAAAAPAVASAEGAAVQ
jgi:hypothetical protein